MAGKFDSAIKDVIEKYPADWLHFSGRTGNFPVQIIDADLATVTAASDKVIRVLEARN